MHLVEGFTPAWLAQLCVAIHMPPAAAQAVQQALPGVNRPPIIALAGGLTEPETAEAARCALKARLAPDEGGFKMLATMLAASCLAQEKLAGMGQGRDVFFATMGGFSRVVKEHEILYGRLGFDQDDWAWRYTAGTLIRLGRLEFEKARHTGPAFAGVEPGEPVIYLHIPGDAKAERKDWDEGHRQAWALWGERPLLCNSWIFSPALENLLPSESGLHRFRGAFLPGPWQPEELLYIRQLFCCADLQARKWPEDTALRRAVKAYVLAGGKIGSAWAAFKA